MFSVWTCVICLLTHSIAMCDFEKKMSGLHPTKIRSKKMSGLHPNRKMAYRYFSMTGNSLIIAKATRIYLTDWAILSSMLDIVWESVGPLNQHGIESLTVNAHTHSTSYSITGRLHAYNNNNNSSMTLRPNSDQSVGLTHLFIITF